MVATNFLPWMEPLVRETLLSELVDAETAPGDGGLPSLGAALVAMTWLADGTRVAAAAPAVAPPADRFKSRSVARP